MGISHEGSQVEQRFRQITGAPKPSSAGQGDALIDGIAVEVKKASSNTVNQVRAVKYIPLVVFDERDGGCWYVVPAHQVVRFVAKKERGQHTENPFESATLSIKDLDGFRISSESMLAETVSSAIRDAAKHPGIAQAMSQVLAEARALAQKSRKTVSATLEEHGL